MFRLYEVGQCASEAIYFIYDYRVDLTRGDVGDQFLQSGSLRVATRESAVVILG